MTNGTPPARPASYNRKIGLVLQGKPSAETSAPTTAKVTVKPDVGPTWMGLHGTF